MWSLASVNAIVLVRHAETDLAGKFCGRSDPDLNLAGERQLSFLVEELAALEIQHIYSSDLRRACETATAIAERCRVAVEFRPGLREIDFGVWEGLRWEEVEQKYPEEAQLWISAFRTRSAPGGESYENFIARVDAEFNQLLLENERTPSAVVTHRGVMQYALTRYFGFSEPDAWRRTENYGAVVVGTPIERPHWVNDVGLRSRWIGGTVSIATKRGDRGQTSLVGGMRVSKADLRVEAYGAIDELNATLGFARSICTNADISAWTADIQKSLFRVGSALASPGEGQAAPPTVTPQDVDHLTDLVHLIEAKEGILSDWSLPGAHTGAAAFEVARTVCRRAERSIVRLMENGTQVQTHTLPYINRLSDLLWLFGRMLELESGVDSRLRDEQHKGARWSKAW
jgi:cob(I)alamin adenosyltransferase